MDGSSHRRGRLALVLRGLLLLVLLLAAVPAAARVPTPEAAVAPAQAATDVRPLINSVGRVLYVPLARQLAPQPPPPPTVSADLFLRPIPLQQVQRGRDLAVEFRYTNTGTGTTASADFSLFYPQRLTVFQNADLASGDALTGFDATRVNVRVANVRPGETRTGRINFLVRRDAGIGELIGLFASYSCQVVGQACRSNLAEVEVLRNDDESGQGGIFTMAVTPDQGPPGTAHTFTGNFFSPGEEIVTWLNTTTGSYPLPVTTRADGSGAIRIVYGTGGLVPGYYSFVAHGRRSSIEGVGAFIVTAARASLDGATAQPTGGLAFASAGTAGPAAFPAQADGEGGVAGTVTNAAGAGVAGIPVEVRDAAGNLVATATTRADGYYFVASGLASGDYTVVARPSLLAPLAAVQFLGDVSSGAIAVAAPELRRGVDLVLPAAGGVRGTISAGGAPLADARVSLVAAGVTIASDVTAADGSYLITSVPPGGYSLVVDPRSASRGASLGVSTQTVTIVAGEIVTPASTLGRSLGSGAIAGKVTDAASGAGLADVVVVIREQTSNTVSVANSGADGSYSSDALAPGSYTVQFLPAFAEDAGVSQYVGEFYNDAASLGAAATVTVAAGETVANIDAGLAVGGAINGVVSGQEGGLAGVFVVAFGADGQAAAFDFSEASGAYRLSGLAAGSYTVEFITDAAPVAATRAYGSAFYDTTPPAEPTPVAMAAGQAVSGIDQTLGRGVQVVGAVTDEETGAGIPGVFVEIYESTSGRPVTSAITDGDGAYATGSLGSGSYKAKFSTVFSPSPATRTYVDEFFSNKATFADATAFLIGRNLGTREINAELRRGGSVSGRVSAADSGDGLGGVVVTARRSGVTQGVATTDSTGAYTVSGLPAGDVTLEFRTETAPSLLVRRYVGELYNNVPLGGVGTPVTVTAQQNRAGIDAELARAP